MKAQVVGPGTLQEVDLATAFASVAAWSQTVAPASDHAQLMSLALKNAIVQRDVGHLIFPDDVQRLAAPADAAAGSPERRMGSRRIGPPVAALAEAVERVAASKRPLIIVGYGARFNMDAVLAIAERLQAPVVTTFKAKGQIADTHPLGCGVLGRNDTPVASWFMNEADLLLVFGASFSDHTGIASYKPTVQVDFDPMSLGKFHAVDVPVLGDVGVTARAMLEALPADAGSVDQRPDVQERWSLWRAEKRSREGDDRHGGVPAAAVFAALNVVVPSNAVMAVDVGNNTYSFVRYFECTGQSVLMSGYLGSIGFAFPAAMGAWAAAPERPIVAIAGDGGFGQYMGELTTAVKYGMPIKLVLINNAELGKISNEQRAERLAVWQTALHNPDFAEFARICGAFGVRVDATRDLPAAFAAAFAHDGPAVVDVISDSRLL